MKQALHPIALAALTWCRSHSSGPSGPGGGSLWVAHGGMQRDEHDRKVALHAMASSLVQLDARTGHRLGQWRLDVARLSLRHLALGTTPGHPTLGVALQAEHEDSLVRRLSPTLAVLQGQRLAVAGHGARCDARACVLARRARRLASALAKRPVHGQPLGSSGHPLRFLAQPPCSLALSFA